MRVLLVDNDPNDLTEIFTGLCDQYVLDVAYSSEDGAYLAQINEYDAIVVDSSLPHTQPSQVGQIVSGSKTNSPLLYLADKNQSVDYKIQVLENGADMVIPKEINSREFKATIGALIRTKSKSLSFKLDKNISIKGISVNTNEKIAYYKKRKINLRRKEFDILEYLISSAGSLVSKEEILEHVWQDGIYVSSNTLEVTILSLRRKIISSGGPKKLIKTHKGYGYKIDI